MAAKIGILGESTATAVATVTVYTVPADKAARVRVLFFCEGAGNQPTYCIRVGSPGSENTFHYQAGANNMAWWSGIAPASTPDPLLSLTIDKEGVQNVVSIDMDVVNTAPEWIITPFPRDYYLSTGDTVVVQIFGNALADHLIQVQGIEDDA